MWEEIARFRDCVEETRNSSFLFLIFWMSLSCLLSREAFISAWDFKSTCNRKQAWEPLLRTLCVLTSGRIFPAAYVFNVFSASNDFLPQHRPLQRRLRNQNHWVWHKSNKSSPIIYFTVVFGHLKESLSFRRSHVWTKPNMCKLLIYTALQMLLDAEKVNWRFSLWAKLKW